MDIAQKIVEFLASPTGLGYVVAVALAVVGYLKSRNDAVVTLVMSAFNQIEKAIPDNSDGKVNKLDLFLKQFSAAYAAKYGAPPADAVLQFASEQVERLVFNANQTPTVVIATPPAAPGDSLTTGTGA